MKKQTKAKKIRAMIGIMLVCVLMLSATTYAWFKLTNSPTVNQLTLKAGTVGSLEISKSENSGFGTDITLSEIQANYCLKPITTFNGKTFYKPVYNSQGKVSSVGSELSSAADLNAIKNKTDANGGYIVQAEYYLKANTNDATQVGIKLAGAGVDDTGVYTYVSDKTASDSAAASVRISFATSNAVAILEPNADLVTSGRDTNQYSMGAYTSTVVKQGKNSKFGASYSDSISGELFKIPTNTPVKITMTIWIEGSDPDCVNDIAGDIMNTQVRFISTEIN